MNLPAWLVRRQNRREVNRSSDPGIVAFFWDGGHPRSNPLRDISVDGAYVETTETWYAGTIVSVMLQPKMIESGGRKPALVSRLSTALPIYRTAAAVLESATPAPEGIASIRVLCRVVRQDQTGIGVQFVESDSRSTKLLRKFIAACSAAQSAAPVSHSPGQSRGPRNEIPPLLLQLRNGALMENSR